MMDSGAPMFISADFQKKYHFPYIVHANMLDAGGKHTGVDIVRVDTVKFGPFVFCNIPALVIEMKGSPLACEGIAGNLGSNLLRFLIVRFDIQARTIEFTDNKRLLSHNLPVMHPMWLNSQSDPHFTININNRLTDTIHFDTGDGALYNISKRRAATFAKMFPAQVKGRGYGVISMGSSGLGQLFDQLILKPEDIDIGGAKTGSDVVYIAGNDKSRLGRRLLDHGVLTLDYIDKKYGFEKYASPRLSAKTTFGFYPVMDNNKLIVGTVWQQPGAAALHIAPGDEILSINKLKIYKLAPCDIEDKMKEEFKHKQIDVTFKTKAGIKKARLTQRIL